MNFSCGESWSSDVRSPRAARASAARMARRGAAAVQPRHDDQRVAGHAELVEGDGRRLAAGDMIEQRRCLDRARHCEHFLHRLRGLEEDHVGSRLGVEVYAADRFFEAKAGPRVGPGDDHRVRVTARLDSRLDFAGEILGRHHALVGQVAAALRELLVLQLNRRRAAPLVQLDCPVGMGDIPEPGVGVRDQRNVQAAGQQCHLVHQLRLSRQADIRQPGHRGGGGRSGHVGDTESSRSGEFRRERRQRRPVRSERSARREVHAAAARKN